jgi:hypothetical protein
MSRLKGCWLIKSQQPFLMFYSGDCDNSCETVL